MSNPSYLALNSMLGQILYSGILSTTSGAAVYTVPASTTARITAIAGTGIPSSTTIATVTNSTTISLSATATATGTGVAIAWGFPAATVLVSLALLKAGDVSDGTHGILASYPLAAGDTLSLRNYLDGAMLATGEAVWMKAGQANAVTVTLSGAVSS
jgi:hypothetical protein